MGNIPTGWDDRGDGDGAANRPASRLAWERLPADPDLHEDLGYDLLELDIIDSKHTDQVVFLPKDEDMLRDEAFIVTERRFVRELGE